jgi:hypothetical protein
VALLGLAKPGGIAPMRLVSGLQTLLETLGVARPRTRWSIQHKLNKSDDSCFVDQNRKNRTACDLALTQRSAIQNIYSDRAIALRGPRRSSVHFDPSNRLCLHVLSEPKLIPLFRRLGHPETLRWATLQRSKASYCISRPTLPAASLGKRVLRHGQKCCS